MENLVTRYRNVTILVAILFAQILGLAVQVRRPGENESSRLIRVWIVSAVTPFEKCIVWTQGSLAGVWHNYVYLRGVRQENRQLNEEIERLRLEQVRLSQDAEQAQRLQSLLGFREQFISQTMPAQVIGSSGSEQSRSVYIDKGARDGIGKVADNDADTGKGIGRDMAVITAAGVVGKVLRVYNSTSQVLLINDQSSGVGVILEKSRLQGILKGTASGELVLEKIMNDEQVEPGERVLTSGGDRVFPKGLPVGTVSQVSPGPESFLKIRVKPVADLDRLEEVLVITKKEEREPSVTDSGPVRAVDILSERLPSVPDKPAVDSKQSMAGAAATSSATTPSAKTEAPGGVVKPRESLTNSTNKPTAATIAAPKTASNPATSGATAKPAAPAVKTVNPAAKPTGSQTKPEPKTGSVPENNPQ